MQPADITTAPSKSSNVWVAFWHALIRFEAEKTAPWLALRNSIGVALPLILGAALGNVANALPAAIGALNVAFSDSTEPYLPRAKRMLAASLLVACAVFAGSVAGAHHGLAVGISAGSAFVAGMLVALSPAAADLGTISLVTLVVFSATPLAPDRALYAGLLAFTGGLVQVLLAVAVWPLRRFGPERRALHELYLELSRTVAAPAPGSIDASKAPPASAASMQAGAMLDRSHSTASERFRLLLSQAERMRLSLLTLRRIRARLRRQTPEGSAARIVDRFFEIYAPLLASVGESLRSGRPPGANAEALRNLDNLSEELRRGDDRGGDMEIEARVQMDALTGQLRSAFELASSATPAGMIAFERRESRQPWYLRLRGTWATLRANLSLKSAACRHAIRLAVCIAIGDSIGRGLGLDRSYWLPMTIAIVLKPDFTATISRGVLRLTGTFAGLLLATALFHWISPEVATQILLVTICMFVMRCFGAANYGILVTAVTAFVVFLFALLGFAPKSVIAARALNTSAGGAIALLAYVLWPTWERTQVPEALAQMLDSYREYFRALRDGFLRPGGVPTSDLERSRRDSRLSRSNLEASLERLFAEPGTTLTTIRSLSAILASSHRLAHALMALEAGLSTSHRPPPEEAFRKFANDVELTLYFQASFLRGSAIPIEGLPDLREDHRQLVRSGDTLITVESDRITNSLNTMTAELFGWSGTLIKSAHAPARNR